MGIVIEALKGLYLRDNKEFLATTARAVVIFAILYLPTLLFNFPHLLYLFSFFGCFCFVALMRGWVSV